MDNSNDQREMDLLTIPTTFGIVLGLLSFLMISILIVYLIWNFIPNIKAIKLERNDRWFGKIGHDGKSSEKDPTDITEFKVNVSNEVLDDLRRRLESVRYVEPIVGTKFNYGFHSDYLKEVVEYWKTQFDWRRQESELNKYNQFTTQINGLKIHFIHVKPSKPVKTVVPILVIHGWPGSVWEYYKSFPLLTDPIDDMAFEVICPSIPGYGFSEAPHQTGFDLRAAAAVFVELMKRLDHCRFFVHGGDWGAAISKTIAKLYSLHVIGMHITMSSSILSLRGWPLFKYITCKDMPSLILNYPEDYKKIYPIGKTLSLLIRESGYMHIQATKPDTIGAALNDSPAGLAAYILEKYSTWTNPSNVNKTDGGLTEKFTLDELLTNVMIYWISNNITSSIRFYKEALYTGNTSNPIKVPTAMADFPSELFKSSRSLMELECLNLVQYTAMPSGGHFGAFEEPKLVTDDIRKFAKTVLNSQ